MAASARCSSSPASTTSCSKSLGSQNPINLVKATVAGLQSPAPPEEVAELRGLSVNGVLGLVDKPEAPVETIAGVNGDGVGRALAAEAEAPAAEAEAPAAERRSSR